MGKIVFKENFDIMEELKARGYNSTKIRKDGLLSQSTITGLRAGIVPLAKLPKLCELLGYQPGYFIRYVPDDLEEK